MNKFSSWKPKEENIKKSQMQRFINYINDKYDLDIKNYSNLYEWSINNVEDFWGSFWDYSDIIYTTQYELVIDDIDRMPGANWFTNSKLNFAQNLLKYRDDGIAIRFFNENGNRSFLTYKDLYFQVASLASSLKKIGIKKGDRICGLLPNIPECVIAMLATASIGAVWSSCSPDFGINGILDRFKQIKPKLLFTTNGYNYNGKQFDLVKKIQSLIPKISSINKTIIIPYISKETNISISNYIFWDDFVDKFATEITFEPLPFDHPIYILYSSGTTGLPKSIVHSAGGTLIQHLKELMLHVDLKRDDSIFYFTTCGWMMWNWLVSSLAMGSTIILYDGSPFYPNNNILHKLSHEWGISIFGTSAKYISNLENKNVKPNEISKFPNLRTILSTGSPLVDKNYDYVYNNWKEDVQLASISGGTDIISCFVLGNPLQPVRRGEIQCIGLGMKVESFNLDGKSVINEKGELVCTQPFPSMPVYFWGDSENKKYFSTYFKNFPNIWHHGDYIEINDDGGIKIFGRSDTTLNPGGVRIGTSEIYQVIDTIKEIEDSLVIGYNVGNDERIILFIKMNNNKILSENFLQNIKQEIRNACSPFHVPYKILQIDGIPYTINGKKVELAVKNVINNQEILNKDSLINPEVLEYYKNLNKIIKNF